MAGEEEFSNLAQEMVDRIKHLKYLYPETFDDMEALMKRLTDSMLQMKEKLTGLSQKENALLTLFIIHEIHKSVDKVFMQEWE